MKSNTLSELFYTHTRKIIHKWDHYFDVYEIVTSHGGSVQLLKKCFGEGGNVHAININPQYQKLEEEKVKKSIDSQSDSKNNFMAKYILIFFVFLTFNSIAQSTRNKNHIQVIGGQSIHGTGDARGLNFSVAYHKNISKRIQWTNSIGSTIHDGKLELFFTNPVGNMQDGSIRYTTAGVQLASYLGYHFIQSNQHQLIFRAGPILRYQSSSNWDDLSVYYPLVTGLPFPVVVFNNREPQRTLALGSSAQIEYDFFVGKSISIGFIGGFQLDTNGDTISQLSFGIGKRF